MGAYVDLSSPFRVCLCGILVAMEFAVGEKELRKFWLGKAEIPSAKIGRDNHNPCMPPFVGFGMNEPLQPPCSFEAISATVNFGKEATSINCDGHS
jgi:hypothetical protein